MRKNYEPAVLEPVDEYNSLLRQICYVQWPSG
jgi:hypothetical protein